MRSENTVMPWSWQVREELLEHYTRSERLRKAELTAILLLNPQSVHYEKEKHLYVYSESRRNHAAADNILQESGKNNFTERRKTYNIKGEIDLSTDPKVIYQDSESKRAFLRGAFIASGSFTDPNKSYQFELVTEQQWEAEELKELLSDFQINARIMERRDRYVVYLKDGEAIVDVLNVIGAHKALLEFENIRIIREMRGSVNRQVNCETANIHKAVAASMKQVKDIRLIQEKMGLDSLEEPLKEICITRLEHPDVALSELGDLMTPPLGKSGVSHRFRKISRIAETLRKEQEKE